MEKTTIKEKIGFGFASMGDATVYGFIGVFLLFFLTTVADISPGIAGAVVALGSVWNAIVNPVVGYLSDKVYTRFGRRRPLMLLFAVPLMISLTLLFTDINIPMGLKPVYYGMLIMIYWTCYTGFFVPYQALGVEYTADYDDRTVLRMFSSIFNMAGALVSMVLPTILVDFMQSFGISLSRAWSLTSLLLGIVTLLTILITVAASKHKDLPCSRPETEYRESARAVTINIFREYISVARLKPMKYLIISSLMGLICYTMIMSDMIYIFTFNMGMSAGATSACLALRGIMAIVLIPIAGKCMLLTDRRTTLISWYIAGAAGMCIVRMIDLPDVWWVIVYMFFATICTCMYWQVMPGIFYDVCEYDRIMNGKSRSATIVSFQGLVEALAIGIGGQLLGLILETAGFDGTASTQTAAAQVWIENSGTVIPVIFLLIASIALYKYPLDKKTYNEMMKKTT